MVSSYEYLRRSVRVIACAIFAAVDIVQAHTQSFDCCRMNDDMGKEHKAVDYLYLSLPLMEKVRRKEWDRLDGFREGHLSSKLRYVISSCRP